MKLIFTALAASALLASPAVAKSCRDAKGKFIKCTEHVVKTTHTTTTSSGKCRDAKGHFAKCSSPGAHPA